VSVTIYCGQPAPAGDADSDSDHADIITKQPNNWQKATMMMSDETERRPLVVRMPEEIKTWIEEKAVQDERSQNTVVVRILRARMMMDAERTG
jgi:hypothetical protein